MVRALQSLHEVNFSICAALWVAAAPVGSEGQPDDGVRAAMQQWLTRPAFTVRLEPGDRPAYEEAKGGAKKKK